MKVTAEEIARIKREAETKILKNKCLSGIWRNMISCCYDRENSGYDYFGGKGIKVCDEWKTFTGFEAWALANGYEPHLTIVRIDISMGYGPGNCRWIPLEEIKKSVAEGRCMLTSNQAITIKLRLQGGASMESLATEFKVSTLVISGIIEGRIWADAHLEGSREHINALKRKKRKGRLKPPPHKPKWWSKMNAQEIFDIRNALLFGKDPAELAMKFDVSMNDIGQIRDPMWGEEHKEMFEKHRVSMAKKAKLLQRKKKVKEIDIF